MTDIKDLREEILDRCFPNPEDFADIDKIKLAMDEYADKRMEQLLEWMVENAVDCDSIEGAKKEGTPVWYKKQWISIKELIQNFL